MSTQPVAAPSQRPATTSCRCTASTTSSCASATPPRPPTSTARRSASSRSPTPGWRPACATASRTCSAQGRIRLVLTGALSRTRDRRAPRPPRRRRAVIALSVAGRDVRLPHGDRARRARACASPTRRPTSTAPCGWPRSRPTATRCTRSSSAAATRGAFLPGYAAARAARRRTPACSRSTTSSATSSSATWTSGSSSTRTSSG